MAEGAGGIWLGEKEAHRDLTTLYSSLQGGSSKVWVSLFSHVTGNRTRGNKDRNSGKGKGTVLSCVGMG